MHSNSLPPLPWLRAFEVSARHLSFTAAAQEMGLSQAAVSKQIKLLELKVGEPLFFRYPRSLGLTKAGEAFLPKVIDAFERLAAGAREVFGEKNSDVLTIRAAVGFAVNWLGLRLPDFINKHPDVSLRLISSVWNEDDNGEGVDLDIRYGDGSWPGIQSTRLTHETMQPVCSPSYFESNNLQKAAEIASHTLIHVLGYKEGWALWLKKAGVKDIPVSTGIQVDNSLLAFELAAQGVGFALGRTSMVGKDLTSGRLVAPFDLAVPTQEGFYLITPENAQMNSQAVLFHDWLVSETNTKYQNRS